MCQEKDSNETEPMTNAERQARFRANRDFKTLPLDVQRKIDNISDTPEEHARRTTIALGYQRIFPG